MCPTQLHQNRLIEIAPRMFARESDIARIVQDGETMSIALVRDGVRIDCYQRFRTLNQTTSWVNGLVKTLDEDYEYTTTDYERARRLREQD